MTPWPMLRKCGAPRTCARTPRPSSRRRAGCGRGLSALGLQREAHADRAEAAVDVEDLPGDARRQVRAQESGGITYILEGHVAAQGRNLRTAAQHFTEPGN